MEEWQLGRERAAFTSPCLPMAWRFDALPSFWGLFLGACLASSRATRLVALPKGRLLIGACFALQGQDKASEGSPEHEEGRWGRGLGAGAAAASHVVPPFSGIGAKNTGTILEVALEGRKMVYGSLLPSLERALASPTSEFRLNKKGTALCSPLL